MVLTNGTEVTSTTYVSFVDYVSVTAILVSCYLTQILSLV